MSTLTDDQCRELLDVKPDATDAEIKTAWRQACKRVHPDHGGTAAMLRLVNDAYNQLKNAQPSHTNTSNNSNKNDKGSDEYNSHNSYEHKKKDRPAQKPTTQTSYTKGWKSRIPQTQPPVTPPSNNKYWDIYKHLILTNAVLFSLTILTVVVLLPISKWFILLTPLAVITARYIPAITLISAPLALISWVFNISVFLTVTTTITCVSIAAIKIFNNWLNKNPVTVLDDLVPYETIEKYNIFGEPDKNQPHLVAANLKTEKLLHDLASVPGVRIFFGLNYSYISAHMYLDALMYDDKVIFFDSILTTPGTYTWDVGGLLIHEGRYVNQTPPLLELHAHKLRQTLPSYTQVLGVMLLHAPGEISVDNTNGPSSMLALDAAEAWETIGSMLVEKPATKIDRHVAFELAKRLPTSSFIS